MTSTTSDLGLLGRKLGATDYGPEMYVREISQRCVGGHELHQQRGNIQTLSEDTHSQLKKNVYQNYGQFIETAKEITYLESEMYQLAHMITEQRNLLHELMGCSVVGDKVFQDSDSADADVEKEEKSSGLKSDFEAGRRKLYDLLEKVEGCSQVADVPSRYLLHDGDLVEMDASENAALHRVHGYLMNDGFMVATWLPNRRGPVRFKFSCLYEIDSLAIVNVRDFGGVMCAFKLLVSPDPRLFQCANADAKSEWMEAFGNAKRDRQKQRDDLAFRRTATFRSAKNPFNDDVADDNHDDDDDDHVEEEDGSQDRDELPEWIQELSDDLEVFIAQREFEEGVELIRRATEFCATAHTAPDSAPIMEVAARLESKKKHLVDVLTEDLKADKSRRGGPRTARKAVQLLVRLDRSTLACDLFLQHRAAILQSALKSGKLEIATVPYVQRQSVTFFNGLLEASAEFRKAFQTSDSNKYSSFLSWVENQLTRFCEERIEKQVFSSSTPLETIASCIEFVRSQACNLRDRGGLDVVYIFDAKFQRNVERYICEARDKHVEAVKLRAQEDKWTPINCFNKSGTDRFAEEMSAAGIPSVRSFIYDDCWVALTRNTTSFTISFLNLADSLLKLLNPSTRALVNDSLVTVFHSHLRHFEQAVRSDRLKDVDAKFVQRNASFLLDSVLSLIEHKYQEKTASDCPKLGKLNSSYGWLRDGTAKATSSKSRHQPDAKSNPNYV